MGWDFMDNGNVTRAELERLQTVQAYQADTVQSLNEALSVQQLELLELRHALRLLESRLREVLAATAENADGEGEAPEAPPPHY